MADNVERSPEKKFKCKHEGCRKTFKHKTQLYRHMKECKHSLPKNKPTKISNFTLIDGLYQCVKCKKCMKGRPNSYRHIKGSCKVKKVRESHVCIICQKCFDYKSDLTRHMKMHIRKGDLLTPSFVIPSSSSAVSELDSPVLDDVSLVDTDESSILTSTLDFSTSSVDNTESSALEELSFTSIQHTNTQSLTTNTTVTKTNRWCEILAYTDAVGIKEADIYHNLIKYLKSIKQNRQKFLSLLFNLFGLERLTVSAFVYFLASQLMMDWRNLKRSLQTWFVSGMEETRGKWSLSVDTRQAIYDTWIANTTPSTDARNDRVSVKIGKLEYLKKYKDIVNKTVQVEEMKNKRGRTNYTANRMIITDTAFSIYKQLVEKASRLALDQY